MKSNIRELTCFGNVSGTFILPHEYKSLEIANIFNMQFFPMGVKLRPLQAFKVLSNFFILSSKFNLFVCSWLYEKWTPSARVGFSGHKILKGFNLHCFNVPNHLPSHLFLFKLRPDTSLKCSRVRNTSSADCTSSTKTVVSLAY